MEALLQPVGGERRADVGDDAEVKEEALTERALLVAHAVTGVERQSLDRAVEALSIMMIGASIMSERGNTTPP